MSNHRLFIACIQCIFLIHTAIVTRCSFGSSQKNNALIYQLNAYLRHPSPSWKRSTRFFLNNKIYRIER